LVVHREPSDGVDDGVLALEGRYELVYRVVIRYSDDLGS
jgi:hypothetical protein